MTTKKTLFSDTLSTAWTFEPTNYGALTASPVVAGDKLICVAGSTLFAVDMHTGKAPVTTALVPKQHWPYSLAFGGGDPQATAAGGFVYFLDKDKLVALRLADGAPRLGWTPPKLNKVSHLFVSGDRLIAVHLDPQGGTLVSAYDTTTGKTVFKEKKVSKQRPGRVAFGDGALFFVASNKLIAVNVDFFDTRWEISVPGDTLSTAVAPLAMDNVVIVPGGSLHGIDIVTGAVKWSVRASTGAATNWETPAAHRPVPAVAATRAANQRAQLPTEAAPNPAAAVAAALAAGIAITSNAAGDVMGIAALTGEVLWKTKVAKPGAPTIIEETVFVTTDDGSRLARFDLLKGASRGTPYILPSPASALHQVIGNGAIHVHDRFGKIEACSFSSQPASFFDGITSRIDVSADEKQFDFGAEDFTAEAWIRSSAGGEIISSYPTEDPNGHGFRLNMGQDGQIRVAITNSNGSSASRGRTRATNAADGEWHHVALIRRDGNFIVMLDGLSLPVLLPPGEAGNVAIGGACALTIGAFVSQKNGRATEHFSGLIREVRVWDRAIDVGTVANNLTVALTGNEPRLRGLWRLDEVQKPSAPVEPRNAAAHHRAVARFVNHASKPTDLLMDDSAYPYLLHEAREQWPYAGTWAARGSNEVTGPASVSNDGVVAFGTNNAIYAVGGHDGKRVWSMRVSKTASNPVADGNGFLMLTEEESLCRLDSRTGAKTQVKGFEKMPLERNVPVIDPVTSAKYLAAATSGGSITIVNRADDSAKSVKIAGPVARIALTDVGLLALTGAPASRQLTLIDPAAGTTRGTIPSGSDAFCIADNWVLCVKDGAIVRIDSANFSLNANAILATSAKIAGTITGMAACVDEDLLVLATDGGGVHGMTLALLSTTWQITLPAGKAGGSNAVNPPILDDDRRIVCTTAGGTLAILDPENGAFLGLYTTKRGAVGKPAFAAGTLYTGCEDAPGNDPKADLDGALHSVVFGETMALRLNLDERGKPIASGIQHAEIDSDMDECTLHLMDVHESCVEAWVNIPVLTGDDAQRAGGGILSVSPARNSGFDINLWIEPNGRLHYSSRAQEENGSWSGVHVQACTTIIDGDWHHVAVSRMHPLPTAPAGAPDRVVLYIDGVAVPTTPGPAPQAPLASALGLKAFVGAIASDTLTATMPFVGMIGEVRVWDTYMVSTEIASRMHVKLRGDEPDLLAYWNFDYEAVHDSARQGHDGKVIGQNQHAPNWWLTDLPFVQPAYPHVTTAASITSQAGAAQTTYSVTVKVCRADGSGMADQEVRLWYMKYHANDPATIMVNTTALKGVRSSADVNPAPGPDGAAGIFIGKTASDGTVKLTVSTASPGHGPALDLWAPFMPENERLHVNVLLDNQKLEKPAPPTLTAQAKLIQDYHYTTGNKINHERDRSTWRVVLQASDSNNAACRFEPISIWAGSGITIESGGKSYSVNEHNQVELTTEANGELTVVLAADGLVAPTLYARAGFMHRNDRIVINPDQDVHASLSKMKNKNLTEKRVTNWKRPEDRKTPEDKEGGTLLAGDQHEHAPKIAEAVRHVTSSVKQSEPDKPLLKSGRPSRARMKLMEMRTGVRSDGLLRSGTIPADALLLDDMRQPEDPPAGDKVVLMRTTAGAPRQAPVNPEGLRDSLKGNLGFVFEKKGTNVRYEMLGTKAQVDRERGRPTVKAAGPVAALSLEAHLLGSFWDDIVDFATDVYNGATKIVISIAEQVEIAIHKMVDGITSIVHTVVNTVKDALNAVAAFFEQLAVGIKKLIEFLRVLFDWQEILNTHDVLRDLFLTVLDITTHSLRNTKPFTDALATIAGAKKPDIPAGLDNLNTAAKGARDQAPSDGEGNSVQGKAMLQKSTGTPARSTQYGGTEPPKPAVPEMGTPLDVLAKEVPALFSDILDLSPANLVARLESIAKKLLAGGLAVIGQAASALMNGLAEVVDWVRRALEAKIDIPFISELYKWITGRDLTLLSVACLALAVPVNLAYALITLLHGKARPFAGDAQNLARDMRAAAGLPPRSGAPVPKTVVGAGLQAAPVPGTPIAPEIPFVITRAFTVMFDLFGDIAFIEEKVKCEGPIEDPAMNMLGLMQGYFGIISVSVQTFACQKNYEARLIAVLGPDQERRWPDKTKDFLPPHEAITYSIYGIQMLLRVLKLKGVVSEVLGLKGGPGVIADITAFKEKHELKVVYSLACVTLGMLPYVIGTTIHNKGVLAARGNDNLTNEYELLAARDILGMIPVLFEWMFTPDGAKMVKRVAPGGAEYIYYGVWLVRHVCGFGGVVLHSVAVFKHGN